MKRLLVLLSVVALVFPLLTTSVSAIVGGYYQETHLKNGDYQQIARIYTYDNDPWKMYVLMLQYKTPEDPNYVVKEYVVFARANVGIWEYERGMYSLGSNQFRPISGRLSQQVMAEVHTIVEFLAGWQPKID